MSSFFAQAFHLRYRQTAMAKNILVVEDNEDVRQAFGSILRHFGYQISEASNGSEAIQKAALVKPSLILLDLNLPDMNGIDVARAINKNQTTNDIPIIACTAYPRSENKEEALFAGIVAYFQKPISAAILKAKIEEFILP